MNCQARILDGLGGKYKCLAEATVKVTVITYAPHLKRQVQTVKCLCPHHRHRYVKRHKYRVEHLGKKSVILEEPITPK